MRLRLPQHRFALALLLGLACQPFVAVPAQAQLFPFRAPPCCPSPCPCPTPAVAPLPATPPGKAEQAPVPLDRGQAALPEPRLGAEQASAAEAESFAAPNMIGHLLLASRSISFRYNRAAGVVNVANNGSTALTNPSVADNNSPIPRDRVSFRFNYFESAQQVTGFGPPVFDAQGVGTSFAHTRDYSVERYTFSFEKTFLDRAASVELRVPFSTGLSSDLDLSAGDITGPGTGSPFGVNTTPERTLGSDGTQFENLTLIFKGLLYSSNPLAVSAGLALGIPSGADTSVRLTDYSGGTTQGQATVQRVRVFDIDNEAWSLAPFVAALYTPTERFFAQGFLQFDFPLNDNTINYTETITRGTLPAVGLLSQNGLIRFPSLDPPFAVRGGISEQPLMQLDLGAGYWVLRDSSRTWITGIAPSLELHYTTTLQDASVVTLPGDPILQIDPNNPQRLIQEQPPRVGNLNNRVDILDLTVASTFLISDRATLATGFSFPLKRAGDRTFDWEFHLQFNYYFGGKGRPFSPNF